MIYINLILAAFILSGLAVLVLDSVILCVGVLTDNFKLTDPNFNFAAALLRWIQCDKCYFMYVQRVHNIEISESDYYNFLRGDNILELSNELNLLAGDYIRLNGRPYIYLIVKIVHTRMGFDYVTVKKIKFFGLLHRLECWFLCRRK